MITAAKLIEALSIVRTRRWNKPLALSINPSSISEVMRDLKDDIQSLGREARQFRTRGELRFYLDLISDDLFVWNAYNAAHNDAVEIEKGIAGILELGSGKVYFWSRGINISVRDFEKMDIEKGFDRMLRLFSEFRVVYGTDPLGGALHYFVKHGDLKRVKAVGDLVLSPQMRDSIINYLDTEGKTPYSVARQMGQDKIADYLKSVGGR